MGCKDALKWYVGVKLRVYYLFNRRIECWALLPLNEAQKAWFSGVAWRT